MTRETRTTIELKDILAVEYECSHCHARHLIPLAKFDRVLLQCPNCKEPLATPAQYDDRVRSDEAILAALVDSLKNTQGLKCKIRLQIEDAPHPA